MKALEFEVQDNFIPSKGRIYLSEQMLEEMYWESKDQLENLSDWRNGENYWCDRVHTLEAMIQEARKGKYIFMKTTYKKH